MAIIKLGPLVSGIRGTIGGTTYSANGSGLYARAWSKPARMRSSNQTPVRANLASLSTSWRQLSTAQRNDWNTWAALPAQARTNSLGETYYLSGFNQFCACNERMLNSNHALQLTAPLYAAPTAPTILTWVFQLVGGTTPSIKVTYAAGTFISTHAAVVFLRYVPLGLWTNAYSGWRCVFQVWNPGSTNFELWPVYWQRYYPTPSTGDQLFWRLYKQTSESQRSPAVTNTSIYS